MTPADRIQAAAVGALLAALLTALWGWTQHLGPVPVAQATGVAYGAVASLLASVLHTPLSGVVVTSARYAGATAAYSVWLAVVGPYAALQLLRGRAARGAFA